MRRRFSPKTIRILLFLLLIVILLLIGAALFGSSGTGIFNRIYVGIEKPMIALGRAAGDEIKGIFSYHDLVRENKDLKKENEKLQEEVVRLTIDSGEAKSLRKMADALGYDLQATSLVSANVISLDGTNWMNAFTIDCGTEKGINKEQVVLAGKALVGTVTDCGKGWAKILPITDKDTRISFVLEGTELMGITKNAADGKLEGYMIDSNADVREGTRVMTSGMGKYPAGLLIGKVSKVSFDGEKQLRRVTIKPDADFVSLNKVSIIL